MLSKDSEILETAFNILNQEYFGGSLNEVIITIQSSPKTYGHATVNKIWREANKKNKGTGGRVDRDSYYELNISAEYLDRPVINIMATLMHEMVHIYCLENNIKDTSNGNRYHNKRFKQEAEKRGLKISCSESNKAIGWSITEPTQEFIETLERLGILDFKLEHYRAGGDQNNIAGTGDKDGDIVKKKKSSTRKYQCPTCKISVRATKEVYLICGNCKITMEKIEK